MMNRNLRNTAKINNYREEKQKIVTRLEQDILPNLMDGYHDAEDCVGEIFYSPDVLDPENETDNLIIKWTGRHENVLEYLIRNSFRKLTEE